MEDPQNSWGPGAEIANYRVESLIARGNLGVIYRALDPQLNRPVALRLLAPGVSAQEEFSQRFVRESRLVASVDHPNILPVYGAGEWSGLLYVAMRYVRGTDLQTELERRGTLPLPEALRILSDTAAALDAAHAAGLIHRDVRPGNILLSEDSHSDGSLSDDTGDGPRHVYLADFGLSVPELSAVGFHAPEQMHDEDVDGRADVYALACVAFTLLAGHPPFDHEDNAHEGGRPRARPAGEPPRLSVERPDVPSAIEAAILRGMERKREDRPPSAGALLRLMSGDAASKGPPLPPGSADAATEPAGDAPDGDGGGDDRITPGRRADSTSAAAGRDPHPGQHGGSRHRAPPGVSRRNRQMIVLGMALLLVLAVGLLLSRMAPSQRYATFSADGIPYTLDVPENWIPRTHRAGDSTVSVLSEADLTAYFADDPDAFEAVGQTAAEDPASVVGLAIYHRPAGLEGQSPGARIGAAEALLPGREAYLVDRGVTAVGDLEGQAMEGSMQLPAATLQVRVLAVEAEPAQLLVFFAPPSLYQDRAGVFDEVADSLRRIG